MYRNRQLYKQSSFTLPKLQQVSYTPFEHPNNQSVSKSNQQNIINESIAQIKPTYGLAYNSQFQIIIGGQNMYPLFIQVNNQNLIICSQDFFLVIKIDVHQDSSIIQQITTSFLKSNVKLGIYNKVVLNQAPTCLKATQNHIYFGMNDGKILCYDIGRKNLTGTCDDFILPIMQIKSISQNQIIAIDCAGNVKSVQFSHKTFLDKIIKTLISTKDISVPYKINKRQKIKKFFSGVMNKKQQANSKKQDIKSDQAKQQNEVKQIQNVGIQGFPYLYTRIELPGDHLGELLLQSIRIIAVYRKNKISIISCTQQFQFIQQQIILQTNNGDEVGMMQFGVGGFENSNNTHLLLVFSINNKLQYYKGIQVQQSYQWLYISNTMFQTKIIDGKFISNNLLIILTQKQVTLCNVNQSPQIIHKFDINKFSYIDFFIQQQGLNFDKKLLSKSILKTINNKNQFFCLQGKRLLTGKIDSWKDYLQRYVNQQKFNQAIILSLKIYNRQLKKLSGINQKQQIRNQQMKQFFQKIALTYISYQIKKQNLDKQHMLSLCIYYLVKTQSFQYLFTTIYQIIKSLNLQENFMNKINYYAEKGQIKVMTQQILDKMVNWYKLRNQKHKLQILVQNFDLTLMEKSILLILCLKQHLYQSMIYICNQHNDFISPILKLCGIYFTQTLQQKDKINIKQILFFYLKQCLLGHNTQYGNSKAYIQMLIQVINFIFIPSTLDMLIGICCQDTIKIINMFFESKILQYILQNQGQFFIKKNDYVQMKVFQQSSINEFKVYEKMLSTLIYILDQQETKNKSIGKVQNKYNSNNLSLLQANQDKEVGNNLIIDRQSLFYQVNRFMSYLILKNQFPFDLKYKIEAINFFIDTVQIQFPYYKVIKIDILIKNKKVQQSMNRFSERQLQQKQIKINGYLMRLMDSLIRSLQTKQQQKYNILNIIMIKLQSSINKNHLIQSICYIYHELEQYSKVLLLYIKTTNSILKSKVFDYLYFNLNQNIQLSTEFINNINCLIQLNYQKTHQLLNNMKPQFCNHQKIVENLQKYPDLQLQYIQQILQIQQKSINGKSIQGNQPKQNKLFNLTESKKNKFSLLHLQIVVKHKFNKLDQYIQKIDYPLQQAFKICQQKSNKTAKAYILIKSGRNMEGLLMLCDIFLKTCDQVFGHLARKKPLQPQRKKNLDQQLKKLLLTCQKQFEIDNERGEKIWEKCIKKIFKHLRISQNIKNQAIPAPIKLILKQIVNDTMKKMFSQMSPEFFTDKFCKKFPQLPFSVFIIAFGQVFDKIEFYSKLQLLQLELQQKDENRQFSKLIKLSLKSNAVWSQCKICQQKISSSEQNKWTIMTHSCGCNFHKRCVQVNKRDKHSQQQQRKKEILAHKCMNEIQNFVQRKGQKSEVYHSQPHQDTQIKKRIVKLKDYELSQSYVFDLPNMEILSFN